MREAWLAFGQLIDAADASLPAMSSIDTSLAPQDIYGPRSHPETFCTMDIEARMCK